ncbi:MAG TPA: hypothetical protein K8V32_11835 [Enteractinococcus helveticum]|uniref:Uncharacterized protein n=1 Tax=Enteractinococcus helveticum TaxID=1837282 RepID=A0A921FNQ0_9MICC|nr:hypothetical protein [Enteractinococcus helveticum]HJF15469.1 hypothetical protein [Enteractinococcus helveticum]
MSSDKAGVDLRQGCNWFPTATNIVRSICNPIDQDEDLFEITFTIFVNAMPTSDGSNNAAALISEIQTSNVNQSHMIAATTMQVLHFFEETPALDNDDEYLAFLSKAAKWGSHLLWDFTVSHMRTLASGLQTPELNLPTTLPGPTLLAADGHTPLDNFAL